MTDARLTQIATTVWAQGSPSAQTTQQALEVWASSGGVGVVGTSLALTTQVAVEEWAKVDHVAGPAAQGAIVMVLA